MSLQVIKRRVVVPYAQSKSQRGRNRSIAPCVFACPNADCTHCDITCEAVDALSSTRCVCACSKVFTSRFGTPLDALKIVLERDEMALWFPVEGVDRSALIRLTGYALAARVRWLNRLFRDLVFVVLRLDELYTCVRGSASRPCLWLAIDPVSKAIP